MPGVRENQGVKPVAGGSPGPSPATLIAWEGCQSQITNHSITNRRERITEQTNPASASLDTKSTREILRIMNREDHRVAPAVRKTLPADCARRGLGSRGHQERWAAGLSWAPAPADGWACSTRRSACPLSGPTAWWRVLAGAPASLTALVEGVEDDPRQAVRDLEKIQIYRVSDVLVGISASGGAPYVLGGMRCARRRARRWWALLAIRKLL